MFIPYRVTGTVTVGGQVVEQFDDIKHAPALGAVTCTFTTTFEDQGARVNMRGQPSSFLGPTDWSGFEHQPAREGRNDEGPAPGRGGAFVVQSQGLRLEIEALDDVRPGVSHPQCAVVDDDAVDVDGSMVSATSNVSASSTRTFHGSEPRVGRKIEVPSVVIPPPPTVSGSSIVSLTVHVSRSITTAWLFRSAAEEHGVVENRGPHDVDG